MKFQRKKRENVDITLISMIDVLFVLLLFFMVSTSFNQHTEVNIKLPEAEGSAAEEHPKTVSLMIDADGIYSLAGDDGLSHQLIDQSRAGLKQELSKLAENSKDVPFIINADDKTPNKAVMTALDIAGQVGFSHITFATLHPTE
ncbi:MAG: biopolymer transporter ExbD [Methylobacter tundripaludum]|jgi:biopolymer transport protein ExbD|uniref:Biopolymer transport protein ExbD n=1 Tax=Methylobacter tundripaludum TaxID=173365 RepID=A0A2S6HG63_9GAMM|nr:biopolymer transporter ExbD [Methylobacter tundripaludum]MDD4905432.1 biopolymer transporter ExbD [Methylobacter tundripaludum]PPK76474.1 biopolymer transport protein ExbD [Methylobacter tundripaludum]